MTSIRSHYTDARVIRAGLDDIKGQLKKWREVRDARTNGYAQEGQNHTRTKKRGKGVQGSKTAKAPKATKAILIK